MTAEVEIVAEYPHGRPIDEQRRAFVYSHLASPEIDIDVTLRACEKARAWIETGKMPESNNKLKAVK